MPPVARKARGVGLQTRRRHAGGVEAAPVQGGHAQAPEKCRHQAGAPKRQRIEAIEATRASGFEHRLHGGHHRGEIVDLQCRTKPVDAGPAQLDGCDGRSPSALRAPRPALCSVSAKRRPLPCAADVAWPMSSSRNSPCSPSCNRRRRAGRETPSTSSISPLNRSAARAGPGAGAQSNCRRSRVVSRAAMSPCTGRRSCAAAGCRGGLVARDGRRAARCRNRR